MDTLHNKLENIKIEVGNTLLRVDLVQAHLFGEHPRSDKGPTSPAPAPSIYSSGLIPQTHDRVNEISALLDELNSRLNALNEALNLTTVDGGPARAVSR